jgi:hypothetical protein
MGKDLEIDSVRVHVGDSSRSDIRQPRGERANAVIETTVVVLAYFLKVFASIVLFERNNSHVPSRLK